MFSICSCQRKVNKFLHIYILYGYLTEVSYSNSSSVDFFENFSKNYFLGEKISPLFLRF